jgi:peroxiredoxin
MRNKKITSVLLYVAGALFLCYLNINTILKASKSKAEQTATIPVFALKNSKGESFSNQNLQPNTPSVFIAFSPDCEHCQYEAKSINERQKDLQNINIVLFTSANDSLTKVFSQTYGLDTLKNIHVISDKNNEIRKLFSVKTIPTVFIYNKEGQLVKQYKGETKIDAIIRAIQ